MKGNNGINSIVLVNRKQKRELVTYLSRIVPSGAYTKNVTNLRRNVSSSPARAQIYEVAKSRIELLEARGPV